MVVQVFGTCTTRRKGKMRKKSERGQIIEECLSIIRKQLKQRYNNKCQVCGKEASNLGVFHILPRGLYPKLVLHNKNILLVCWNPCHDHWHRHRTDSPQGQLVQDKIIQLRGQNYERDLKLIDTYHPSLNLTYLKTYLASLEKLEKIYDINNNTFS